MLSSVARSLTCATRQQSCARCSSGDDAGYEGAAFRLAAGTRLRYDLPRRLPPLLLGAWGPRGAALAGEIADEIKVGGSASPAVVRLVRERAAVGSRAVGRPVDEIKIVVGAVTVVAADGEAARRRARTEVAKYLAVVAELDTTSALPAGLASEVRRLVAGRRRCVRGHPDPG